jgi:hypothetical protein
MSRRDRIAPFALAAFSLLLPVLVTEAGVSADLLLAAPALFLFLPLLAGRYVGEQRLRTLAVRHAAPVRAPSVARAIPRAARALLPRGGRLIAAALAERGPPPPVLLLAR